MSHVRTVDRIKMIGDWIFVKPDHEDQLVGGILIPDTAKPPSQKGTIEAIDPKSERFHKGQRVLFRRRSALGFIEIENVKYVKLKTGLIIGTFKEDKISSVRATHRNVLLDWEQAPKEFVGTGLLRPESHRQAYYTGMVLSVGWDVEKVKVGDRVFFDQFCGVERFDEDMQRFGFVTEEDIYCSGVPTRVETGVLS